ncbi:LysE family translocator [uncultured Tenacibaculum sp.]|uniref:LysE family translocator n=1 Tax=uncultured Tenacibaculum sp. TaxID=174713 RepID=UPI00262470D4|nr:LysE family transporter [uncultured Tenacibaculum sp.]
MESLDYSNAYGVGAFMALMIGPVFFMLLKTSALKGFRAAIAFDIGVILGDVTFILIAYFGSRSLLEKIKDDPRLFLIGGLILVVYGFITFLDKKNKKEVDESEVDVPKSNNYFKLFLNGYFLNFINIGVLAGWLTIMVIVGPLLGMDPNLIFWYFVKVVIGYFALDLIKILLAKQLRSKLTPLVIYKVKKGMGVLLIVFGAVMMLKSFISKEELDKLINSVEITKKK